MSIEEEFAKGMEDGSVRPEDFCYSSFIKEGLLHECYEIVSDDASDGRAIVIINDPLYMSINLFRGKTCVFVELERKEDGEGKIARLWKMIAEFRESI